MFLVITTPSARDKLLEWLDRCHSISEAARQMNVSYRHASVTIQKTNDAAGEALVEAVTGGKHGGGARLTPRGRQASRLFRELRDRLRQEAATLLPRLVRPAAATGLHVGAAISLEAALDELALDYALRRPALPVRIVLGASDALAEQILAGAALDLFISADATQLARLAAAGALAAGATTPLAENALAAVAPVTSKLTARRPAELLNPLVSRIAMATPPCPLGAYTQAYLEGLDLYEAFAARALVVDHSRAVIAAVHAGQADAGLVYSSAAASATGCRVLFRIGRSGRLIRYAGAVVHAARQPTAAQDFLTFLSSKEAARRFRRWAFYPSGPQPRSALVPNDRTSVTTPFGHFAIGTRPGTAAPIRPNASAPPFGSSAHFCRSRAEASDLPSAILPLTMEKGKVKYGIARRSQTDSSVPARGGVRGRQRPCKCPGR
jgi:molybdate transport system substrate-binding protein